MENNNIDYLAEPKTSGSFTVVLDIESNRLLITDGVNDIAIPIMQLHHLAGTLMAMDSVLFLSGLLSDN